MVLNWLLPLIFSVVPVKVMREEEPEQPSKDVPPVIVRVLPEKVIADPLSLMFESLAPLSSAVPPVTAITVELIVVPEMLEPSSIFKAVPANAIRFPGPEISEKELCVFMVSDPETPTFITGDVEVDVVEIWDMDTLLIVAVPPVTLIRDVVRPVEEDTVTLLRVSVPALLLISTVPAAPPLSFTDSSLVSPAPLFVRKVPPLTEQSRICISTVFSLAGLVVKTFPLIEGVVFGEDAVPRP